MATTHTETFSFDGIGPVEFFSLAVQACQALSYQIAFINSTGLIAYKQGGLFPSQTELRVQIFDTEASILSRSTGTGWFDFGRNKKDVKNYILALIEQKKNSNPEELERIYQELSIHFIGPEEDPLLQPIPTGREELKGFLSLFIPGKEIFTTPLFIHANLFLFIAMALTGVHWLQPSQESLLLWGANFREYTTHGEWWRLISCCFLHIGLFHLLMNMYALLYIGLLLEPILGKLRFFIAYILTGIVASATSLYWNELTVSAGASGAIFGMYGLFLALLTTKLVDKQARKPMLSSILIFIAYNLLGGGNSHVDHAAHLGGLLSGIVVGYIFYFALRQGGNKRVGLATLGMSVLVTATMTLFLCTHLRGDLNKYINAMNQLQRLEAEAMLVNSIPPEEKDKILLTLRNTGIPNWKRSLNILDSCKHFNLPEEVTKRNHIIQEYCRLRLRFFEDYEKGLVENSDRYNEEMKRIDQQIAEKLKALNSMK